MLFVLRRLVLVASLAFFSSLGMLQLGIAIALCLIDLIILLRVMPFKSGADNAVSVMCQFFLLAFYCGLGVIQYVEWRTKLWVVWGCMGCVLLGNTIGFFILVNQKRLDCKKEKETRRELREKAQRREDTSILTMIRPFTRSLPSVSSFVKSV